MKQLSFIAHHPAHHTWELYVDGAARNNPGPAGVGIYLLKDGKSVLETGAFLGDKTNNQAEYIALLLGLFYAEKYMKLHDKIVIKSDSQLLVRQFLGMYKIKNEFLKKFHDKIKEFLSNYNYSFVHVKRELNTVADALANKAIDKKMPLPEDFLTLLHS